MVLAAHEYMDLTYQMWEGSWEDGAQVWQSEPTMAVRLFPLVINPCTDS